MNLNYTYREFVFGGVTNRGLVANSLPSLVDNSIECYQSVFLFCEEFKKYADENKSVSAYQGKIYCDWIPVDIDNEDLTTAKLHVLKLLEHLFKQYGVKPAQLKYYFSGSKGFHIMFPSSLIALTPSENLHMQIKTFVERFTKDLNVSVDLKVYDKTRIFRIPNTQNIKSGLYKIPLNFDELLTLDIEKIKELAKTPRVLPFEVSWKQTLNTNLLSLLTESPSATSPQNVVSIDSTQSEPKKYTKICIHKMLAGVGKGNRDSTALRLAVHFKKQGVTKDVAYQMLLTWNKKNQPPLEDRDIEIKVNSAFSGSYDFGCNDSVLQSFCSPDCVYKNKPKVEEKLNAIIDEPNAPTADDIYSLVDVEKRYKEYVASVETYRIHLGIKEIDDTIRGIARGESCLILGRTSVGKTVFVLNIIKHIVLAQKVPVLFFTLEAPAEQIYERLAQMVLGMSGREVEETYKEGNSPQELIDLLGKYVYIIDKGFLTTTQITEYITMTEEKYKQKMACVIIDYVGRINEYGGSQYDKTSKIVFNLTNIAKETDVALIFLHHASSKAVTEGEPITLANALDSGRAVDAPDFVLGLWRTITQEETNLLNVAILKSRKGNIAQAILSFNTKTLNLTEITKEDPAVDVNVDMEKDLPNFVVDGKCAKTDEQVCNLGYACDACPYNKRDENTAQTDIGTSLTGENNEIST